MFNKVMGLVLLLAAAAAPLAVDGQTAPQDDTYSIVALDPQDPGNGGEGPNRP
ncbi:hypothetical protein [Lentzea sp. CA-135723]|uniref:hypothetical protein n=1 Tax=Lentzea sp. CA-135723 TaxID=3239950 RepID=UPI003D8D7C6F